MYKILCVNIIVYIYIHYIYIYIYKTFRDIPNRMIKTYPSDVGASLGNGRL